MTLAPRSAFSATTTAANDIPNEIPNTQLDLIPNMPYVSDPALNKYAINAQQYPKVTAMLAGFMRGFRIKVTYFRRCQQGNSNNRTNISDYATERNVLTSEYERIFDFEMTLRQKLNFDYDTSKAAGSVTGDAIFYAGIEPTVGDMFLYSIGNGKYGLFRVTQVSSMNWTNDRVYLVSFSIQSVPDSSDMDALVGPVVRDLVWTKMATYGQCYSVISSTAYLLLEKIKTFRKELCRYYHRVFYDTDMNAYMRPDGIYDPCCVRFMLGKITMLDVPVRSKQLYLLDDLVYDGSLWARLNDRYVTTLNGISPYCEYATVTANSLSTYVNELFNHLVVLPQKYIPNQSTVVVTPPTTTDPSSETGTTTSGFTSPITAGVTSPVSDYVSVGDPGVPPTPRKAPSPTSGYLYHPGNLVMGSESPLSATDQSGNYYVLSQAFWTGDTANMTQLESIIYTIITKRTIDQTADSIGDIMLNVYDLAVSDQYYFIPLYLHMIDLLIQYIPRDLDSPRVW